MHPGMIAAQTPDRIAIRLGDETRTYGELDARSAAVARLMASLGLRPGDVMAIWAGNDIDLLTVANAGQRSGLYYLPIGASLTAAEAAYILADSGAKALIVDASHAGLVPEVARAEATLTDLPVFSLGGGALPDLWEVASACSAPDPEALEGDDMMYTSGTTGKPKGVRRPLKLGPWGSDARRAERLRDLFGMDADTVFLSPAPLYHAAPMRFTMTVLRLGGTVALLPKFDAEAALTAIMETGATHTQWVPTMFSRMLALPDDVRARYTAPAHRKAIHAGAPCPPEVKRRMIDWFGPILHEYYSGTESIGFTHIDSPDWLRKPGSVGQTWGCKVQIVGDDGTPLPAGESGLVYFSGKAKLEYHNAPDKTAEAHGPDGWATMGDIGYLDDEGFLFLTDRRAFTIVTGGVNVYPREVEDVLTADPRVAHAAVVGVPDPDFGEAVQAAIQPAPDTDPAALAKDLFAACRAALAPYKRPKRIAVVEALPLTDSGKLQKREIQSAYQNPADRGFSEKELSNGPA